MHVRLSVYKRMEWERLQGSLGWFQAEGLPTLEAVPGYRTIFFGVNPEEGKAAAITFWESEEALRASELVEEELRTEAVSRAGVERGRVVDRYEVALELPGEKDAAHARLIRWSGLVGSGIDPGLEIFQEERAPLLSELPGFSGVIVAVDSTRGKVLALFLWASSESLRGSEDWGRETAARLESATGPRRRSIFEAYQVALLPELP